MRDVVSWVLGLNLQHKVIRTSSVEYMPFALSLCLFLNGATWLAYALSIKDLFQLVNSITQNTQACTKYKTLDLPSHYFL